MREIREINKIFIKETVKNLLSPRIEYWKSLKVPVSLQFLMACNILLIYQDVYLSKNSNNQMTNRFYSEMYKEYQLNYTNIESPSDVLDWFVKRLVSTSIKNETNIPLLIILRIEELNPKLLDYYRGQNVFFKQYSDIKEFYYDDPISFMQNEIKSYQREWKSTLIPVVSLLGVGLVSLILNTKTWRFISDLPLFQGYIISPGQPSGFEELLFFCGIFLILTAMFLLVVALGDQPDYYPDINYRELEIGVYRFTDLLFVHRSITGEWEVPPFFLSGNLPESIKDNLKMFRKDMYIDPDKEIYKYLPSLGHAAPYYHEVVEQRYVFHRNGLLANGFYRNSIFNLNKKQREDIGQSLSSTLFQTTKKPMLCSVNDQPDLPGEVLNLINYFFNLNVCGVNQYSGVKPQEKHLQEASNLSCNFIT